MALLKIGIQPRSARGSDDPATPSSLGFVVEYDADQFDHTAVLADVATYIGDESIGPIDGKPLQSLAYEARANRIWIVTATFARPRYGTHAGTAGDVESELSTIGKTTRVLTSLSRIESKAPAGLSVPSVGNAINASERGVEGVDAPLPSFDFTITNYLDKGDADAAYWLSIFGASATVNDATFNAGRYGTFAAGSVLFLGAAETSSRTSDEVKVEFRFSALPNSGAFTDSGMSFTGKDGWDVLWYIFAEVTDGAARGRKPVAGFIDRYIARSDFGDIPVVVPS